MSQRKALVAAWRTGDTTVAELCRQFGVSRKTAYKWLARFAAEGEAGLAERSCRPQHAPQQTPPDVERLVAEARVLHPAWGARKLKRWLENQGHTGIPAASTVTAILRRCGLLDEREGARHRATQRFEMAQPNLLWQMDFKGDIPAGERRCHPLTVLDDHSRFLLGLRACPDQQRVTVQTHLTDLFRTYGLPERMLMDNGTPWGALPESRYTKLTVWLLRLHIRVSHGRVYHPQTQGKEERIHRTLKDELLKRTSASTLSQWQQWFNAWRTVYNTERPHDALDLQTPATRYRKSERVFPEQLPELEYPAGAALRRVSSGGEISVRGKMRRVGKAFAGERLGILPDPLVDGRMEVFYGPMYVLTLDFRLD